MKQIFEPEHGDRVDERDAVFIDENAGRVPVYLGDGAWQVTVDRGPRLEFNIAVTQDNLRWITTHFTAL